MQFQNDTDCTNPEMIITPGEEEPRAEEPDVLSPTIKSVVTKDEGDQENEWIDDGVTGDISPNMFLDGECSEDCLSSDELYDKDGAGATIVPSSSVTFGSGFDDNHSRDGEAMDVEIASIDRLVNQGDPLAAAASVKQGRPSSRSNDKLVQEFGKSVLDSLAEDFQEEGIRDLWSDFASTIAKEKTLDVKKLAKQMPEEKSGLTRPRSSTWSWEKPGSNTSGKDSEDQSGAGNYWIGGGIPGYPFLPNIHIGEDVFEGTGDANPDITVPQRADRTSQQWGSESGIEEDATPRASPITAHGGNEDNSLIGANDEDMRRSVDQAPTTDAVRAAHMETSDANTVPNLDGMSPLLTNSQGYAWAEEARTPKGWLSPLQSPEMSTPPHTSDHYLDGLKGIFQDPPGGGFQGASEETPLQVPEDEEVGGEQFVARSETASMNQEVSSPPSGGLLFKEGLSVVRSKERRENEVVPKEADESEPLEPERKAPVWWPSWLSLLSMFIPVLSPYSDGQGYLSQEQLGQAESSKFSRGSMWQRIVWLSNWSCNESLHEEENVDETLFKYEPIGSHFVEGGGSGEELHPPLQNESEAPPAQNSKPPSLPRVLVMDQVNAWLDLLNLLDTVVERCQDGCVMGYHKMWHMIDPKFISDRRTTNGKARRVALSTRLSAYILLMHVLVLVNLYMLANLQQERHIWAVANRTTRRYLLERIHRYGGGGQPLWLDWDPAWGLDLGEVGAKSVLLLKDGIEALIGR